MPTLGLRRLACAHRVSPEPTYADVHPVGGGFDPLTHTFTQLVERGRHYLTPTIGVACDVAGYRSQ